MFAYIRRKNFAKIPKMFHEIFSRFLKILFDALENHVKKSGL